MPTAEAFDLAASRFRDAADDSRQVVKPVRSATGPDVLAGGKLAESVDLLIEDVDARLGPIADDLETLADTARERAELTRQAAAAAAAYASAKAQFDEDDLRWKTENAEFGLNPTTAEPGPRPVAPTPPTIPPFADI